MEVSRCAGCILDSFVVMLGVAGFESDGVSVLSCVVGVFMGVCVVIAVSMWSYLIVLCSCAIEMGVSIAGVWLSLPFLGSGCT